MTLPVVAAAQAVTLAGQGGIAHARVNWGRWVADCASPWCTGAMQIEPGQPAMTCLDCGWPTASIHWPADPSAIWWVLAMRPDEKTRNYEPGETVAQLITENAAHHLPVPADELGVVLRTLAGRVVGGGLVHELPDAGRRIDAAREIGA